MAQKVDISPVNISFDKFNSLISIMQAFPDADNCKRFIAEQRWPDGDVVCPYCKLHHCQNRKDGKYRCPNCLHNFSATLGTLFHNTKIPLIKWFMAMYLLSAHKKGVSSYQLARDIEVTQKTAWYILSRVRKLFSQDTEALELDKDVECDEAYIGGQEKYKHTDKKTEGTQGRSLKTKAAVFGMVQRGHEQEEDAKGPKGGKVVAKHTQDVQGATLSAIIRQHVKPDSRIFTDEYIGYNSLVESEYTHAVVNHGEKQFVDGEAHTNTIEGFWSQLKRSIFGIYHFVSKGHLQDYVDEAVFRYNTCKGTSGDRFKTMFERSIQVIRQKDVKMAKAA